VAAKPPPGGAIRPLLTAEGGDPGAIGRGDELSERPDAAEKIRGGKDQAIGPIVGYVMRETRGRADGGEVTRLVREQLRV
jgi:aspartyl-tRNA(Asn)/glutamyl-tRNA(Gln) amidotransferase subunit B